MCMEKEGCGLHGLACFAQDIRAAFASEANPRHESGPESSGEQELLGIQRPDVLFQRRRPPPSAPGLAGPRGGFPSLPCAVVGRGCGLSP